MSIAERQLNRVYMSAERQYEKTCPMCKVTKPLAEFKKSGRVVAEPARDVYSYCKPCALERDREWRRRNPDKKRAYTLRNNLLKYGITPEQYNELLLAQGRRCAICGTDEPGNKKNSAGETRFAVDHDHETQKVRGLLCSFCNNGIGHFRDDVALMARAIAYLEESKEK
jgi:hypothetical protein